MSQFPDEYIICPHWADFSCILRVGRNKSKAADGSVSPWGIVIYMSACFSFARNCRNRMHHLKGWCFKMLKNYHSENGRCCFEEIPRTKVKLILEIGSFSVFELTSLSLAGQFFQIEKPPYKLLSGWESEPKRWSWKLRRQECCLLKLKTNG